MLIRIVDETFGDKLIPDGDHAEVFMHAYGLPLDAGAEEGGFLVGGPIGEG